MGGADGKKVLLLATHRLSQYAGAEALLPRRRDRRVAGRNPERVQRETADRLARRDRKRERRHDLSDLRGRTWITIDAELRTCTATSNTGFDYLVLNNEIPMLDYVAKETGGVSAWDSTEVAKLLPRIGDDFDSYYSLAYRATPGKAAARKVEVRVKDPKLSVRSRKQFVPKNENTRMEDRVIGALFGNTPPSAFRFAVTSDPPTRRKDKTLPDSGDGAGADRRADVAARRGHRLQRRVLRLPGVGIDDRRRERDASRHAAVLDRRRRSGASEERPLHLHDLGGVADAVAARGARRVRRSVARLRGGTGQSAAAVGEVISTG